MKEIHGVEAYLRKGKSLRPIYQLNFFDRLPFPEFEISSNPVRTLDEAVEGDFLPTINFLRKTYVPNYDYGEKDSLPSAIVWVNANSEQFDSTPLEHSYNELPWYVLINFHTLFYQQTAREGSKKGRKTPVAYHPGTQDWENDILRSTFELYEKLKLFPYELYENIEIDLKTYSTTRSVRLLTEFFWSRGKRHRVEATDLLSGYLFFHYWAELKRRLKR